MICEQCGKKSATVHITKIENGKKSDMHLCDQCAVTCSPFNMSETFTMGDLLAGLISSGSVPLKMDILQQPKCDICGLSYDKFKSTGRFGCSNCYNVFGERLNPLFKRVHGNTTHTGKIPSRAGVRIKTIRLVEKLKIELEKAIQNEEYEKAAQLRDEIKEIAAKSKEGVADVLD